MSIDTQRYALTLHCVRAGMEITPSQCQDATFYTNEHTNGDGYPANRINPPLLNILLANYLLMEFTAPHSARAEKYVINIPTRPSALICSAVINTENVNPLCERFFNAAENDFDTIRTVPRLLLWRHKTTIFRTIIAITVDTV